MKKLTLTAIILLSSIFAFTQDYNITTVKIKADNGGSSFDVICKDYDYYSTVTVSEVTLVVDKVDDIGSTVLITCYESDGTCIFEFDYENKKFRFYSNSKLILTGTILKTI